MILPPSILDDLGRRFPLVAYDPRLHMSGDSLVVKRLRAASNLPRGKPTKHEIIRGAVALVFGLPITLFAALAPAYFAIKSGGSWWWMILGFVGMLVLPAAVILFMTRRIASRRIALVYRRARLCASCGYDLDATEARVGGCRICPECGAAWRIGKS